MKKYTVLFAVAVALTLAACGSGSAAKETKDSVAAQVDSGAVSQDTTTAHIPADSAATK